MDGAHANAYETDTNEDPKFWTPEERENLKKPMLVPAKLVAPTQVCGWEPYKEISLSKKAEAALQTAKDLFDNYLANAEYAPPLAELLRPSVLDAYKEVAAEGFSLYSKMRPDKSELQRARCFTHDRLGELDIKKEDYHHLIDFKLTIDAGKLFAEHVSMWPGCFAMRRGNSGKAASCGRKLTDADRAARGIAHDVTVTDVVVSQEGYIAYRSGNVTELSESQKEYMDFRARKIAMGTVGHNVPGPPTYPSYLNRDEATADDEYRKMRKDLKRQREEVAKDKRDANRLLHFNKTIEELELRQRENRAVVDQLAGELDVLRRRHTLHAVGPPRASTLYLPCTLL